MNLNIDRTNWKKVKLGDVAFEYSKRINNPSDSEFDRFVGSSNIEQWDFRVKSWENTSSVTSAMKLFEPNDYLLVRRSLYASDFRERAPRAHFYGVCSGDILTIKENPEMIVDGFLIGILNSPALWKYIVANGSGSITRRIHWKDLANYEFLLPPKEEQAKLAELLWAMDAVLEKEKMVLERLEKALKSSIKYHFIKARNVIRIKDLGKVITGATPPTYNDNYWQGGTIPFITPSEIDDSIYVNNTERFLSESGAAKSRLLKANSVLIVCIGSTIGKVAINEVESCSNQQINAIIPHKDYSAIYILHLLRYHKSKILARSGATAVPIINKTEFESIKLPILEKPEIPIFENKVIGFSKSINLIKSKIASSQALQKSLINQIF